MTFDPRTEVTEAREVRDLWLGLLLAPAAFLTNLEVAYAMVPHACSAGSRLLVHVVHAVCLLMAGGGALIALRMWRLHGETWPGEAGGRISRSRFLSGVGLLLSLFVVMVILAQWIPSFVLSPCQ
jgi:small-conductance mechanosensitive channel